MIPRESHSPVSKEEFLRAQALREKGEAFPSLLVQLRGGHRSAGVVLAIPPHLPLPDLPVPPSLPPSQVALPPQACAPHTAAVAAPCTAAACGQAERS